MVARLHAVVEPGRFVIVTSDSGTLSAKSGNKGSHRSGNRQVQVFMNSRPELVKGSHKRPYATGLWLLSGGLLRKAKSKARSTSQGRSENVALAGEKVSKSPGGIGMTLLTWVLAGLLFIAVAWIVADRVTAWLVRNGGLTIRIEVEDESD